MDSGPDCDWEAPAESLGSTGEAGAWAQFLSLTQYLRGMGVPSRHD